MEDSNKKRKAFDIKNAISGISGGAALVLSGHPLDTIKIRLQTQVKVDGVAPFAGPIDCVFKTVRNEGFRGLYKGVSSPLLGVPPIYSLVFFSYGTSKQMLSPRNAAPGELLSIPRIFLAGCITGVVTTIITTPIELLKSRLQIQYANPAHTLERYTGLLDCARKIVAKEGFRALYQGTVVTLYRDIPGTGSYFAMYELCCRLLLDPEHQSSLKKSLIILFAGGMGGIFNWLSVFPIDVIKSRIQTSPAQRYPPGTKGVVMCGLELVAAEGPKGLFKGLSPALIRAFPANACCFLAFELTLKLLNCI
ncbi:mitochondrial carnitine/acylcarnitine carrier protein-like [Schistocerca gregaria]|uniref:mitochondrial carnitine/acylcarnitine carrier protein-like n=1 Tax=Schistocerca gregaria TaxID=7010 RepID=UPI00211E0E75|nr:mitochondrial carnitine/acylcarnitine carrier protein-like [Schistocerca gregaria]